MSILDKKIQLGTEQMNAHDWMIAIMYLVVCVAFLYFHTEVAIWVWLFINLREMMGRMEHKSIGKPLGKRNG